MRGQLSLTTTSLRVMDRLTTTSLRVMDLYLKKARSVEHKPNKTRSWNKAKKLLKTIKLSIATLIQIEICHRLNKKFMTLCMEKACMRTMIRVNLLEMKYNNRPKGTNKLLG